MLIEEVLDILKEVELILANVALEGESEHSEMAALTLASVIQRKGILNEALELESFNDDDGEEAFAMNVLLSNLRRIEHERSSLTFHGIHPSVLEAVWSACDSAECDQLEEWEADLILTRIVEQHHGKRLLKTNKEENDTGTAKED